MSGEGATGALLDDDGRAAAAAVEEEAEGDSSRSNAKGSLSTSSSASSRRARFDSRSLTLECRLDLRGEAEGAAEAAEGASRAKKSVRLADDDAAAGRFLLPLLLLMLPDALSAREGREWIWRGVG